MKNNKKVEKINTLYTKSIEKFWHLVGHEVDLPSKNSYKCINIGRYKLFLYKTNKEIKAFLNQCPHRGARIFNNDKGIAPLTCPYHGWTFTPKKTFVPKLETYQNNLDPQKARLITWNVEVRSGFIYIAKNPEFSLEEQLGEEVLNIINKIGSSIKKCESIQKLTYKANWLISVENSLELLHVATVHPKSLDELNLEDCIDKLWNWAFLVTAKPQNKRISNLSKNLKKGISSNIDINGYWSLSLFPFSQISTTEGISFAIQTFYPGEDPLIEKTDFCTTLYSPSLKDNTIGNSLKFFYESVTDLNYKVFKEDAEICSYLPLGSWDFFSSKYSSSLEIKVNHFRECCRKVINL